MSHWTALTPSLVPKFLSKGEGDPPYERRTEEVKQANRLHATHAEILSRSGFTEYTDGVLVLQ